MKHRLRWTGFRLTEPQAVVADANITMVSKMSDQLYKLNVECDFLWPETESFAQYDLLVVPALYAAPETLLQKINDYVAAGGHLFTTFKTGFTDENLKVFMTVNHNESVSGYFLQSFWFPSR